MSRRPKGGLLRRHRDFRLLWCGETTGKFGSAVTGVAMPLVAVSTLHAGTFEIGLLSAAAWTPWLLIGLPAGAWVDRLRRRPVMLVADAASVVLFASVPVAAGLGRLSVGLLLTVTLLAGTAAVFFQTAYSACLPGILDPGDRAEGNAKLHGSASAAQIVGLGSGGLIAQLTGAVNGLLADAATFLVSLLCLTALRHREPPPAGAGSRSGTLAGEVREGLRLIARDPWLRSLTIFSAASNLALMGYQAIQVVFLVRTVGLSPGPVGALIAATGAGGMAGAFAARRAADRIGTARATLLFELGVPVLALLMPLTTRGPGVLLFVTGGFCVSTGAVAGNVIRAGFQQRYCPPRLLGRLTATAAFVSYGTIPLGSLLGGTLGTLLGLRAAMAITTAGIPLAALCLWFSPLRHTRDLPASPRQDGPEPARPFRPAVNTGAGRPQRVRPHPARGAPRAGVIQIRMSALAEQTRWLDATGQAALVTSGEVEPAELVAAAIERIEQLDPALGAVTLRYFDEARKAAADDPTGPLAGVPFLVKDLLTDVAGQVCTHANVALKAQARRAAADDPLVARYRAAGLILAGRTASSEFGTVPAAESAAWGATRNPWNTAFSPGGSSGGSAAAVAAGMVPAAHGTDAAGSIRVPASCCGLVGLKPSRTGEAPVASVMDLIEPMALTRSVRDAALLLAVARADVGMAPADGDLAGPGAVPGRLRIGLLDTRPDGAPVHPECAEAARSAARLLESLGHHVEPGFPAALGDSTLDPLFGAFWSSGMTWLLSEVGRQLGRDVTEADVEPLNWALGASATEVTDEDRRAVRDGVAGFTRSVVSWWDDHDLLLTPTLAEPPLPSGTLGPDPANPMAPLLRSVQWAPFTPFANFTGQPAISLPLHVDATGLPIGVQLVAAPGREDLLLRVAAQLETAAPWQDRRPAV